MDLRIALNALPFGVKRRMVDFMDTKTLVTFRDVNDETEELAKRRHITAVETLYVPTFELREKYKLDLNSTTYYVTNKVNVTFTSVAEADQLIPIIKGSYTHLRLDGTYTWRQALRLLTPHVKYCLWVGEIQMDKSEREEFTNELCQILANRTITMVIQQELPFFQSFRLERKVLRSRVNVTPSFQCCYVRNMVNRLIRIACIHKGDPGAPRPYRHVVT